MGNIALIAAAGSGSRMKMSTKKQYLEIAGQPMLARTVLLFQKNKKIDDIYIITPPEDISLCQKVVSQWCGQRKIKGIISGGKTRFESVYNGITQIKLEEKDKVLIHDGARPFVSQSLIDAIVDKLYQQDVCGVIPGISVKDTIKKVNGDNIVGTPPRDQLIAAQTPQGFCAQTLKDLYIKADKDNLQGLTDDSSLLEHYKYPVYYIIGEEKNFKVTTPQDLQIAQLQVKEGTK
ncbi:2-C-methyl-D-erythritol 4-phosphate cytidylyltransferase [Proteinivorax hydrogeniformans]|uniref:2-C-methyl-D-erythritol 4-phosphate cytidylyltransferase n=1 Tax=Proteinivorax hydrogeniformans TaxID=1826727 RepID=A0AAU8HTH9_9FIRM